MYCRMSALSTKATSILSVMLEVVRITTLECLQAEGRGPVTPGLCLDHTPATRGVRRDALEGAGHHCPASCTPSQDCCAALHPGSAHTPPQGVCSVRPQKPADGPDAFAHGEALISAVPLTAPSPEPPHPQPHDCVSHGARSHTRLRFSRPPMP